MSTKQLKIVIAHALAVVMLLGCMLAGLNATFGAGPVKASAEDGESTENTLEISDDGEGGEEGSLTDTVPVPVWYWYDEDNTTLHLSGVEISGYDQTTDANPSFRYAETTKIVIDNTIRPRTTNSWFDYLYIIPGKIGASLTEIEGLNNLDTSNVTDMTYMFRGCSNLTSLDVSHFNTSNVRNMFGMFAECSGLTSLDVNSFDTSKVTEKYGMCGMFGACSGLTSLDVSSFDTSKVADMSYMFDGCSSLETIYAAPGADWSGIEVASDYMFDGCTSLVGGNGTVWDENYIDMSYARIDGLNGQPGYFTEKKPAPAPAPFTPSVAPGATAEEAESAILAMTTDADPAGSMYAPLKAKSTKQTKKSVTLKWNGVGGAVRYVVYGNRCNHKGAVYGMQKLSETAGTSVKLGSIAGATVKKGTYYKFIVVAIDAGNRVVSTSKVVHAASTGGKVGNHKKVTVKKAVTKKAKKLKAGKSLKLKAKAVKKKLKVKKHAKAVRYESSNPAVATVTDSGKVYAVSKGSCVVYAYTQNGVSKAVKVTVK